MTFDEKGIYLVYTCHMTYLVIYQVYTRYIPGIWPTWSYVGYILGIYHDYNISRDSRWGRHLALGKWQRYCCTFKLLWYPSRCIRLGYRILMIRHPGKLWTCRVKDIWILVCSNHTIVICSNTLYNRNYNFLEICHCKLILKNTFTLWYHDGNFFQNISI